MIANLADGKINQLCSCNGRSKDVGYDNGGVGGSGIVGVAAVVATVILAVSGVELGAAFCVRVCRGYCPWRETRSE